MDKEKSKIPGANYFIRQEREWAIAEGNIRAIVLWLLGPFIFFFIVFGVFLEIKEDMALKYALIAGAITSITIYFIHNRKSK